jgi:hypothetical protein
VENCFAVFNHGIYRPNFAKNIEGRPVTKQIRKTQNTKRSICPGALIIKHYATNVYVVVDV